MEANQHHFVLEEAEEEVAAEALQSRQSRRSNNSNAIAAAVFSINGNGNGIVGSLGSSCDSITESETANGTGYESPSEEVGEDGRLHNSVYFDQQNGIWKCRHCNWTYCTESQLIDSQNIKGHLHTLNVKTFNRQGLSFIIKTKGAESTNGVFEMKNGSAASSILGINFHIKDLEVQKRIIKETNDQFSENFDDEGFSGSSLTTLKESPEEQNVKSKLVDNEIRPGGDFDVIEESDQEEAKFDVEMVLKKQNTHDLYCPNCSSCITRRVILRRRKLKIRNARRKPKHNESETDFASELGSIHQNSADLQVHDTVDNQSSGSQAVAADANHSDDKPEIFRCLSCFSFFIPTGDGFKLLRCFGDSSITENESVKNLQKTTASNRNWFSFIFATDKKKTTIEQDIFAARNEIQAHQNGLGSSIASPQLGLVNDLGRKEIADSSEQENRYAENISNNVGQKTENAIEKSDTGHAASNNDIGDSVQPLYSKSSSDTVSYQQRLHSGTSITDVTGEPAEDSLLGPQDGVIFPLPSTCEPLVPGQSHIEIDKNVNMTMPEEQTVQNDQVSLVQGTPLPTQFFGKVEAQNDSFVVCHETQGDSITSSSQGTQIPAKMKIGVGETLFNAAGNKSVGGDVIVTVETRSGETAASHIAQNGEGSIEARRMLLSVNHTHMSAERGTEVTVDILKSIVYGGLIESITSLGVVSSAAGAGSATWNILALGLANLIGGLFIIGHNLIELKNDTSGGSSNPINEHEDRYQETLGRRENFLLHAIVAILSFLVFGMLPPVIYGFSFRKSDNRDLKLAVVGGASLFCIIILAIAKAYSRRQPKHYIRTLLYFVSIGVMASGASYIVGDLIAKLVERIGLSETIPMDLPWASY